MTTPLAPPIVLVHGWGGSFESTWQRSGFTALLEDAGLDVIGVDLLGHGDAPKPHQSEAYADLTERVVGALPTQPVDAGYMANAWVRMRHHDFDELRAMLDDVGATVTVHAR